MCGVDWRKENRFDRWSVVQGSSLPKWEKDIRWRDPHSPDWSLWRKKWQRPTFEWHRLEHDDVHLVTNNSKLKIIVRSVKNIFFSSSKFLLPHREEFDRVSFDHRLKEWLNEAVLRKPIAIANAERKDEKRRSRGEEKFVQRTCNLRIDDKTKDKRINKHSADSFFFSSSISTEFSLFDGVAWKKWLTMLEKSWWSLKMLNGWFRFVRKTWFFYLKMTKSGENVFKIFWT